MPSYKTLFPDRWIKPEVIGNKRVRVTVENVRVEKLFNPASKKNEDRLIAKFVGKELRLILNQTNARTLESIFHSDDFALWQGAEIMLSTAKAPNGKDTIVVSAVAGNTGAPAPAAASTPAPISTAPDDGLWEPSHHDDEDFYPGDHPAKQPAPEQAAARPQGGAAAPVGARPVNEGNSACTACHAPPGKPHASNCTASQGATSENVGARPAEAGTRIDEPRARPVQAPLDFEQRVFKAVMALYQSSVPLQPGTSEFMRKCRNADHDSAMKMTFKYYESINVMLQEVLGCNDDEADMVMAALTGYRCTATVLPGQLVHGYLMKPMRNNDADALSALAEIYELCVSIWVEEQEGEHVAE